MKRIFIPLSLLFLCTTGIAQQFEEVTLSSHRFNYSSSDIADVNKDGTPDIIINGSNLSTYKISGEVFSNEQGNFSLLSNLGVNAINRGDCKFIDYNNDGFPDLVVTGVTGDSKIKLHILKNDGSGNFAFAKEEVGTTNRSTLEVFDYNHDGFLDFAQNGKTGMYTADPQVLDLFINNEGNSFTLNKFREGTIGGGFKFIDLNNDYELDLVIFGFKADHKQIFQVYLNKNGNYTLHQELDAFSSGEIDYADLNGDGFLDLVVIGSRNYEEYLSVFYNDGTGSFRPDRIIGGGLSAAYIKLGDLNNDGYYDFVVKGNDKSYNPKTKVYIYDNVDKKFKLKNTTLPNVSGTGGQIEIFDYNNDNKLDLLINGEDSTDFSNPLYINRIYKNISPEENKAPTPPTSLHTEEQNNKIVFTWDGATDDKTPAESLQYELSVGSEKGKSDLAKYIVTTKGWYLMKDKLPNKFYWSVKSIDASKTYSVASNESEANLSTYTATKETVRVFPNPFSNEIYIDNPQKVQSIKVYTPIGQSISPKLENGKINTQNWEKGLYLLEYILKDGSKKTLKLIKK